MVGCMTTPPIQIVEQGSLPKSHVCWKSNRCPSCLIHCCFNSFQIWGTLHLCKLRLQIQRSNLPQQLLHLRRSRKRRSVALAQIQKSWETTASCRMVRMPVESSSKLTCNAWEPKGSVSDTLLHHGNSTPVSVVVRFWSWTAYDE